MFTPLSEHAESDPRRTRPHLVAAAACGLASLLFFGVNVGTATQLFTVMPEFFDRVPGVFWIGTALLIVQALPLAVASRRPLLQLLLVHACFLALTVLLVDPLFTTSPTLLVSVFAFALHSRHRPRVLALTLGALVVAYVLLYLGIIAAFDSTLHPSAAMTVIMRAMSIYAPPALGGLLFKSWRRSAELAEQAHQAEADAERARSAAHAAAERARMARELHDISAHHLSALLLQSHATKRLLRRDPSQAAELLDGITEQARETLNGLRSIVGILRETEPLGAPDSTVERRHEPVPTLGDIPALIERVRGIHPGVSLTTHGAESHCPLAVSRSAYRIVQESVTNAAKHAGGAEIHVELAWAPHSLQLNIENEAPRRRRSLPAEEPRRRYGILGMEERVTALGGSFAAGERDGGGWRVTATLPLANGAHR